MQYFYAASQIKSNSGKRNPPKENTFRRRFDYDEQLTRQIGIR